MCVCVCVCACVCVCTFNCINTESTVLSDCQLLANMTAYQELMLV